MPNTKSLYEGQKSPVGSIESVSWLAGSWRGEAFGGVSEEIWSEPLGGTMMGMYRLKSEGEISFHEFMLVEEVEGTLILRIKHFNPGLKGWDEKDQSVDFPFVVLAEREVYFDGLTYRRLADGSLDVYLRVKMKDGTTTEQHFQFQRYAG